jgi:DNA-binding LacI/PurR family transcriptional regulator
MRITIRDIAEKAGVSKTAVSFAFNNPDRISRETRSRIHRIAEELGYVPDPVARTLARRRIGTIGLLLPQSVAEVFRNPYMAELLRGIGTVCQREGLTVSLIPPLKGMVSLAIRSAMVDALILFGIGLDHGIGRLLGQRSLPFVTVDGEPVAGVPNVGIDDGEAAFRLMEHVLSLGHRRIQIIGLHSIPRTLTDAGGSRTVERRLLGFRRALDACGLRLARDGVHTHSVEGSVSAAAALAGRILSAEPRPTAIVCMSDVTAYGVYRACQELAIGIPADLSVAAFDDLALSPLLAPPLTTVHQPGFQKGKHAAELVLGLLHGKTRPSVRLAFELRVRGSTAPARG